MANIEISSGKKRKKKSKDKEKEKNYVDIVVKSQSPNKKMKLKKQHDDDDEEMSFAYIEGAPSTGVVSSPIKSDKVLGWSQDDMSTLINNIAKCLPKNDNAKYSTLVEKLDWNKVKFGRHSALECKEKWNEISQKLRRYRTLTDMITDATVWLKTPWQTYNNSKKLKHPDFPKKPLTPYFRYFMEKREKSGKSHPGKSVTDLAKILSVKYSQLSEKKKKKYKDQYDKAYEEYKVKLEAFKAAHPEIDFGTIGKHQSQTGVIGPVKPRTPHQLFNEDKLSRVIPSNPEAKKEAIEQIKQSWNALSDGKRIKWIRRSLADIGRYELELVEFMKEHPTFEPPKIKSTLNKAEKELKDKYDGKPERPPNSGYSLFSKFLLRELKDIPSKEKMVEIAKRWKELPDEDREGYNRDAQKAMSKYVEKFEAYLNGLPEEERAKVMSENKVKLPNEKKLKAQSKSSTSKNVTFSESHSPSKSGDSKPNKEMTSMMCYQQERIQTLKAKHANKSDIELMLIAAQEWQEKLTDKKKEKYYKMGETFTSMMPQSSSTSPSSTVTSPSSSSKKNTKKNAKNKKAGLEFMQREPKKPPKSGYSLFSSEKLSSLIKFEPNKRMKEIARLWKFVVDEREKEDYDRRAKESNKRYQRELETFKKSLTADQIKLYLELQQKGKSKGKAKKEKDKSDSVVHANVLKTIVPTSGKHDGDSESEYEDAEEHDKEESEEEEESDSDEEESESD